MRNFSKVLMAVFIVSGLFRAEQTSAADPKTLRSLARSKTCPDPNIWSQTWQCANTGCKKLDSCEHAYYMMLACGKFRRDGDEDGVPCEKKCRSVDDDPEAKYVWSKSEKLSCVKQHGN